MRNYNESIFSMIKGIHELIPTDDLGGNSFSKCYLLACLATELNFNNYVEIGVYRGKSLFSVAVPFILAGGTAIGIDPYIQEAAHEQDIEDVTLRNCVNTLISKTDFDDVYNDVMNIKTIIGYDDSVKIIRDLSSNAVLHLREIGHKIDMLHIDGNHDTKFVKEDYEYYLPLINDGGAIVFDDINWPSVNVIYQKAKLENTLIHEEETFGVLLKKRVE